MNTDDHYRKYLWARWRRLGRSSTAWIALTALVALLSTTPADVLSLPGWHILATIPATVLLVLLCIAPIIYLRAKTLQHAPPTAAPAAPSTRTYLSLITRTINDPHAGRITLWYLWASIITTSVLTHLWTWRHEAPSSNVGADVRTLDLGMWKPTARHPYHLNERVLYLYFGNACFALWLAHKDIFDGAWGKERWPADNASLGERLTTRMTRSALWQLPLYAVLHGCAYSVLFWLLRRQVSALLIRHSFGLFRPFIAQLARNKSLVGWTMPARLLALHYATAILLRLPAIVFDISATQRLDFSPLAKGRKADAYIIGALQSTDDYYLASDPAPRSPTWGVRMLTFGDQTFTALELADRSHQAENRKRVFDDLSTKPTAWTSLFQGCMTQLGKSYQRLVARGGRLAAASASATASSTAPARGPVTSIPTAQARQVESVFYVPPSQTKPAALVDGVKATDARLASLASTGISYLRQRAPHAKEALGHAGERALEWISPLEARVPEDVKRPVVKTLTEAGEAARQGAESVKQSVEATKGRLGEVAAQVAKPVVDAEWRSKGLWPLFDRCFNVVAPRGGFRRAGVDWCMRRVERFMRRVERAFARRWAADEIEFVLPRRRIDADLFRTLAAYVAASLHEDTYGQVQNCVPEVMDMLVKYHVELIAYRGEYMERAEARGKQAWVDEARRVWEDEVQMMSQVIEQAVRNIQQVFGEHMKAFEISPGVLQAIKAMTQEA
ncbi:hypothetical protein NliqN6_3572 [Naganishia liquefaciens]|uniref:Nucleoporin protein Ndc1-Nup n=1 Tax=Naganishia liquefaciens TaxID=104408 RepID=A0A8H3TTY0_9TREE|nr:hypothetical protein NliqN6_3572 [Naganishia liquefaciens]